jgi:hypothetical protein
MIFVQFLMLVVPIIPCIWAANYDLANLPIEDRKSICTKNTAFCLNACLQKISTNICVIDTLQFSCVCQDGTFPVDLHYFPIQAQQCVGENQDCRNECATSGKIGNELDTCSNLCDQKFVCGTPNAMEKKNFQVQPNIASSIIANESKTTTMMESKTTMMESTMGSTTIMATTIMATTTAMTGNKATTIPTTMTTTTSAHTIASSHSATFTPIANNGNSLNDVYDTWKIVNLFVISFFVFVYLLQ